MTEISWVCLFSYCAFSPNERAGLSPSKTLSRRRDLFFLEALPGRRGGK